MGAHDSAQDGDAGQNVIPFDNLAVDVAIDVDSDASVADDDVGFMEDSAGPSVTHVKPAAPGMWLYMMSPLMVS